MTDVLHAASGLECATCGHEWPADVVSGESEPDVPVKDSNGNVLRDGDAVTLAKDLKVKGSSKTLKAGTKVKKIRLVDAEQNAGHNIDARADGMAVLLKSKFVKKV
jgi:protein PhnA